MCWLVLANFAAFVRATWYGQRMNPTIPSTFGAAPATSMPTYQRPDPPLPIPIREIVAQYDKAMNNNPTMEAAVGFRSATPPSNPIKDRGSETIHRDREALERAQMAAALTVAKQAEQDEVKLTLDRLRATRKARGGVGAPLQVPIHLQSSAAIVITDADLKPTSRGELEDQAAQIDPDAEIDTDEGG